MASPTALTVQAFTRQRILRTFVGRELVDEL
jgi:hypothetical protein